MTAQVQLEKWLINQDQPILNQLGIDSIVSKFDQNLDIIDANDLEMKLLTKLKELFLAEQQGEDSEVIKNQLAIFISKFF